MIDVKGRRCEFPTCPKIAGYGTEGQQPSACLTHRTPDMLDMKQNRQHRLNPSKRGDISVKIRGNGNGANAIEGSTYASDWGQRNRKGVFTVLPGSIGGGSSGAMDGGSSSGSTSGLAPSLDLLRMSRRNGAPSHQWYADSVYPPSISRNPGATRSWGIGGTGTQQPNGSSGPGSAATGWTINPQPVSAHGAPNFSMEPLESQHRSSPHWTQAQENSSAGPDAAEGAAHYPGPHESTVLPSMANRSCVSLPTLNGAGLSGGRFAPNGGSYGSDGSGHVGGSGGRTSTEYWRSPAPAPHLFSDGGFPPHLSGVPLLVEQRGCSIMPALPGVGGSGGNHGVPAIKSEHGVVTSEMATMPEVESDDVWLRDLMQGAIGRENGPQQGGGGSGSSLEMPHTAQVPGMGPGMLRASPPSNSGGPQAYPRHLAVGPPPAEHGGPLSRSGTPSSMPGGDDRDRRYLHQHRHQRQTSGGDGNGSGGGRSPQVSRILPAPQPDSFSGLSMGGSVGYVRDQHSGGGANYNARGKGWQVNLPVPMGRSPSTSSTGASPPRESWETTDAMPSRRSSDRSESGGAGGVSMSSGGGGGNPGVGGSGGMSSAGTRGAAPSLNHVFAGFPAAQVYDGGHGAGFNSNLQFIPPASRDASPSWSGVQS